MRHLLALLLLVSLAMTLKAEAFDHYDPTTLDASATAALQAGDESTARILLERAVLLAPHDGRLRRKLNQLKARQEGRVAVADADADAAEATSAGSRDNPRLLPEPPPIWPLK
jgi:hypothetical protein